MCAPRQLFFFLCAPEMPQSWASLQKVYYAENAGVGLKKRVCHSLSSLFSESTGICKGVCPVRAHPERTKVCSEKLAASLERPGTRHDLDSVHEHIIKCYRD